MDAIEKKLYSELRKTRQELLEKLTDDNASSLIKPMIKDELADIEYTLKKMDEGLFGICEISGEVMPEELLNIIPTLKSMDDCSKLDYFYRKSLFS
ncbi:hypothetical protein BGM26_01915 [Bacillus sp. FJAT-29790]|uniref:hypothetical protein n=1 Tax=Bacillus sp. FJAT-29790 TaxID=1895002 RepID=UPI001C2262F5|nr:hypothetical protein [Bacillus sp. FJAT-29790]MBU8877745.1 hypothetical protein [Bacillus sp. FJAT-29790]